MRVTVVDAGGNLHQHAGGFGADEAAFAAEQVVLEGGGRGCRLRRVVWIVGIGFGAADPIFGETLEQAEEDHAEVVVDYRGVPFLEELVLYGAVVIEQGVERHRVEVKAAGGVVDGGEPCLKVIDGAVKADKVADGCCGYREPAEARAVGRVPELVEEGGELRPEALLQAHHRFHEGVASAADGQHSNEAVPVDQVVVDASLNQAEHVAEHGFVLFDHMRGDAEDLAELDVDLAVGAACEAEGQRGGDPFVALDYVGVVP